jgi:hypothetical protein
VREEGRTESNGNGRLYAVLSGNFGLGAGPIQSAIRVKRQVKSVSQSPEHRSLNRSTHPRSESFPLLIILSSYSTVTQKKNISNPSFKMTLVSSADSAEAIRKKKQTRQATAVSLCLIWMFRRFAAGFTEFGRGGMFLSRGYRSLGQGKARQTRRDGCPISASISAPIRSTLLNRILSAELLHSSARRLSRNGSRNI